MTLTPYQPPTGLISDDTVFSAPGRWRDANMVRFYNGNWQVVGGWESLTLDLLGGVCRSVIGWTDVNVGLNFGFGTHQTLEAWQTGGLYDITPGPPGPVIFLDLAHSNATPIMTLITDSKVRVVQFNHGRVVGQTVRLGGFAVPVGGLDVNGDWVIVAGPASDVNNFYVQHTTPATATENGGGPNGWVQATPFVGFTSGSIDGTGGAGYGTGAYGLGTYGSPSTEDFFPLTWSLSIWGNQLIANPRGQTIFYWDTNTANIAQPMPNAPEVVTFALVTPSRQVMAIGCNEEVSGDFNQLCIRWSDIEDYSVWNTAADNNAGEYIVEGGGRLVAGQVIGNYVFVWSNMALYLGTFIGSPSQSWSFEKVADNCGLISPGGAVIRGQTAAWIAPDNTFWSCTLGGAPVFVDCPLRLDFAENLATGQFDKIVAATTSMFEEVTWFYPDKRDGLENSRELTLSPEGWCRGRMGRTAYVDSGPAPNPVGVTAGGNVYWQEKGNAADGGVLSGWIESTDFYIGEAQGGFKVNGVWPDFSGQVGAMNLRAFVREFPQSVERVHGPWALAPGRSKRDFRISGRIMRLRWDFGSAPAYARAGKTQVDVEPIGGR